MAVDQDVAFTAGVLFARTEGIMPAPESTHALAACIEHARSCTASGSEEVLVVGLSGHGLLDLSAYDAYLHGELPASV